MFSETAFKQYMHYLTDALKHHNVSILNWYACPHPPDVKCNCRKPNTGLLDVACNSYDIDLSQSWMIGDILLDIEFAKRGGVQSVLLTNGYETEWDVKKFSIPKYCAPDLLSAAQTIIENEKTTTT
jgi:histidinol phosphatase-like enzyme